jgi:(S)-3,5-dihydroxyphenylglycine transaminase
MSQTNYVINTRLFDGYLERMNFLNEVSIIHPRAISFGSGRPDKAFFNVKDLIDNFHSFARMHDRDNEEDGDEFYNSLGQYNKTNGIINEAIVRLLHNDENIRAKPEDIILTVGGQEGMAIAINSLFANEKDVLLTSDPSYIGFIGYAKIYGTPMVSIRRDEDSVSLDHLETTILKLKKQGKNPKVFYEVPDFHNPSGAYMPLAKRKGLIELAEKHNFLIVEDNPYGYFIYDGEKIPTLKALDNYRRVIHLGSFAKTIFPSLRLGYLVVDQCFSHNHREVKLVDEFKKVKSFITVNTSTLIQGMVGSYLQKQDYSLKKANARKIAAFKTKRDAMVEALANHFSSTGTGENRVKWSKPAGGFFLALEVPFEITDALLKECVEEYGVIFCPMSYFYLEEALGARQMRLAFSNLPIETIKEGIARLAAFIKSKL